MGVLRHRHRHHISSSLSFATILLINLTLLLLSSALGLHPTRNLKLTERVLLIEQRLRGPGSSPPTCRSKCGRCSPCKPVRVSVQPGFTSTLEYYPEAWRCKCRNKLFMP